MECLHDQRAVCWLCSDQDERWAEWRTRAGLSLEPPNLMAVRYVVAPFLCIVCNWPVEDGRSDMCELCAQLAVGVEAS